MKATALLLALVLAPRPAAGQGPYFPPRHAWEHRAPAGASFDDARLQAAVAYAAASADTSRTDSASIANVRPTEAPYNAVVGPWVERRGPTGGMIVRGGRIVAEWGDTKAADMTFSVTKSFLSTVAGLAFDDGLLASVDDTVARAVPIPEFTADPHNARITWRELLTQTSEWQGTLWGKPDWADRYNPRTGRRPVLEPGSAWTYNDVRVNVLAVALLYVWRRPLPQVLRERIMDPIGASPTWRWWGYRNSWVEIDGLNVQSVSGGGHWGGGLQISTEDMARFGLLLLRDGRWQERQLVSSRWIAQATSPTAVRPGYGFLWWLNTGRTAIPAAPARAFSAQGQGGNYIYVDPEHDLVIVLRWTRDFPGVVERVLAALR
jgi:CubicO group peptidase (beta-lactamase class C family)